MLAQGDKGTYLNRLDALDDQLQQFCSCSWTANRNRSVSSDDIQSLSRCIYASGFVYPGMHLQVSSKGRQNQFESGLSSCRIFFVRAAWRAAGSAQAEATQPCRCRSPEYIYAGDERDEESLVRGAPVF
jgi:hypothetical protein